MTRLRVTAGLLGLAMLIGGCGSSGRSAGGPSPGSTARPTATAASGGVSADRPCGSAAAAPAHYDHVVWVVFENHGADAVIGATDAPYLTRLATACGQATDYHGVAHPSLPNYLAMTSGSTHGVTDDAGPASHPVDGPSLFSQAQDWRSLQDGMAKPCSSGNAGRYAVKHNPVQYYPGLAADCAARSVPMTSPPDLSARFTFVTPDLCHDMHDCDVRTGDDWLAGWLPAVLDAPQYRAGRTAIFVTFDEDEGDSGQRVPLLAIAPPVHSGTQVGVTADHYALLRTTEELLGLTPYLGQAATAPSLRAAFRL